MMLQPAPRGGAIAEELAAWLAAAQPSTLPPAARETVGRLFLDVCGLCVAARQSEYIRATLASVDRGGRCTAIGHEGAFDAFGAALACRRGGRPRCARGL